MVELAGRGAASQARSEDAVLVCSLREWRAERLFSIRDLARLAGVSRTTVYLTETGRTVPRPAVMRRMAVALRVDPHTVAEFRQAIERASHARPGPEMAGSLRGAPVPSRG